MEYEITTRDVPEVRVVFIRGRTTRDGLSAFVGASFDQLTDRLAAQRAAPHGETMVIYHEFGPSGIDAEVCVPIEPALVVGAGLEWRVVPGATVAATLHCGSYDGLPEAYGAVAAWIGRHRLDEAGPPRERYIVGPGEDVPEADYRTMIEMPVTRALVGAS